MGWYKKATGKDFVERVKMILKSHPFTKAIADYYHIPLDDVDKSLQLEVCDLNGEFAKGNGKVIRLDRKLLNKEFFRENFHFVIHEFFHWVKRRSEALFYFNDPEEVQSFVLQITWQLINGHSLDEVKAEIYPIIEAHFKDKVRSKQVFGEMLQKAEALYRIYKKGGPFSI
jgi:hypothetical protein